MPIHPLVCLALALAMLALPVRGGAAVLHGALADRDLTVVAMGPDGRAVTSAEQRFTLSLPWTSGRLVILDADTTVRGPVVLAVQVAGKTHPVAKAVRKGLCADSGARGVMRFRSKGRKLVLGALQVDEHVAYPRRRLRPSVLDTASGLASLDANCVPLGAGKLGLVVAAGALGAATAGSVEDAAGGESDPDADGIPNAVDADDDGDGILDNDDRGGGGLPPAAGPDRFRVFSNFHQDIEHSINANAMTVSKGMIDAALVRQAGLAFEVVGDGAEVELDCGSLPYCSAGGTGRSREPYPSGVEFPEGADGDGDGLGTIVGGPTGDFQFAPFGDAAPEHPASDVLRAGDVYIERYTGIDGTPVEVPGMLNFVFHTTPAVRRVDTGAHVYDVTYPVVAGAPGTRANPFRVPVDGAVVVTLTVWRPQRQGVVEAGEASLVDMGNLRLVTNLPQGPCSGGTGPGDPPVCPNGPGLCAPSVYVESDPALEIVGDGLQDTLGDRAADPASTFTYTIDLSSCVESVPGVVWDAGEAVMVPVQMMNVYGDNATQNVFFAREAP